MSAADLRSYMTEMQMARASKSFDGMDRAEKAREELVKRLSEPLDLTPERLKEILQPLRAKLRAAAERGQTELMVMRFPNVAVHRQGARDQQRGSAWPETLTGRPRQAYELWRDQLKPAGFRLSRDDHRMAGRAARRCRLLPEMGRRQAIEAGRHG